MDGDRRAATCGLWGFARAATSRRTRRASWSCRKPCRRISARRRNLPILHAWQGRMPCDATAKRPSVCPVRTRRSSRCRRHTGRTAAGWPLTRRAALWIPLSAGAGVMTDAAKNPRLSDRRPYLPPRIRSSLCCPVRGAGLPRRGCLLRVRDTSSGSTASSLESSRPPSERAASTATTTMSAIRPSKFTTYLPPTVAGPQLPGGLDGRRRFFLV